MDPRLLKHYNLELQHLRETGAEFAQEFPKIAARLGMHGLEVADPYVERLLEGVAFLAARVHLKLDAEFPRFTQALLEIVYPHYLAPTPAMLIAQFAPDLNDPNLASGPTSPPRQHDDAAPRARTTCTNCEFRTAQDVRLWPVQVASASCFAFAPDLPLNALPIARQVRGGLRIRLRATAGLRFVPDPDRSRSRFHVTGRDDVANTLHELCLSSGLGTLVVPAGTTTRWHEFLPPASVRPVGFTDDEALLPVTAAVVPGIPAAAGVLLVSAAVPVLRVERARSRPRPRGGERGGVGGALLSRRDGAREHGGRVELRPVLHAGDQPVREARGPHPRGRRELRIPRRARPDAAARLRGLLGHRRGWPRCGQRQRAGVPALVLGIQRRVPFGPVRVLHDAARAPAGSGRRTAAGTADRPTSAPRSSCRSWIRPRRPSPATCASCPCGRPARTATCRC